MRIKKILWNFGAGFINRIILEMIRFIVRTIFIYSLSESFLGANSLFSNILNVLNIAELGIGGSIAFALYKPLAEQDKEQIKALMSFYRKAYRAVGLVILGAGLCLLPVLPYIVKEQIEGLNLYILFLLYLLHSVVSYLFAAYKSTLLTADQKGYKVTIVATLCSILTSVAQIVVLFLRPGSSSISFYLYTFIGILSTVVSNLLTARIADHLYPYLMEKDIQPIQPGTRKKLFQNTGALFISKISRVALDSSDSIIISATQLQGLSLNGKYSNYTLLVSLVNSFFSLISRAISASLGNFMAEESVRKSKDLLDRMYLVFTWLYGFCFICLWCLLNPFIGGVWITEEWLLSEQLVFLVSFNFLVNGMDFAPVRFIESAGLYWQAKSRWVISAVLNIFLSVLFGVTFGWGLEGVVLATAVAMLGMTCFDPYIIFKHLFHERPFCYYLRYMVSLAGIVLTGALTNAICSWLAPAYTLSSFILRLLICLVLPNLLWLAVLWRTKLFRDTFAMVLSYIRILIKKNI